MKAAGHGLSIAVPPGWEARIFRREPAAAVLHAASFTLRPQDGDYGAAATGRMRADDLFISLVEFEVDEHMRAGVGLFAAAGAPASVGAHDFHHAQLQVMRSGHLGCQRFFTTAGRAFCLYAVIRPVRRDAVQLSARLTAVIRTLRIAEAAASLPR